METNCQFIKVGHDCLAPHFHKNKKKKNKLKTTYCKKLKTPENDQPALLGSIKANRLSPSWPQETHTHSVGIYMQILEK